MYFPRRHRRKLFFPPGLLALAFLLLLGGRQIGQDARLRPRTVVKLNMPSLHPDSINQLSSTLYLSKNKLDAFRNWNNFTINGNKTADSVTLSKAINLLSNYQQDTTHENGIRIIFTSDAEYKSIIELINKLMKNNIKKYWFDIKHTPTTFYSITDIHSPHANADKMFICGNYNYTIYPAEESTPF